MQNQDSALDNNIQGKAPEKQESLLINLAFNLLVPTLVLTKLSGEDFLGIKLAIVVALAFPIVYGLHDFFTRGKLNFFSKPQLSSC